MTIFFIKIESRIFSLFYDRSTKTIFEAELNNTERRNTFCVSRLIEDVFTLNTNQLSYVNLKKKS